MKNEGWRPRRTIIFTSWAAEEYALTGSREFVEDFISKLAHRAVAYLNVDICTGFEFIALVERYNWPSPSDFNLD